MLVVADATDKQDIFSSPASSTTLYYSWTSFNAKRCLGRDFYNYHMSKSATKQHPLFQLTPENPESQMPQMLLTDVSIWKRKADAPLPANYTPASRQSDMGHTYEQRK